MIDINHNAGIAAIRGNKNRRFTRKAPVPDWDHECLFDRPGHIGVGGGPAPKASSGLAACQHGHRAAVLRPAGIIVTARDGTLLAIANGPNS
jgi:hypothetical protein